MKTFFLRLLPYLITLTIGAALFIATDNHIKSSSLHGLMMGIAAGLLSIPMVFICYEIVKQRCDKTVNETIVNHLYFELNHSIVGIVTCITKLLGTDQLNSENLLQYTQMSKSALKETIHFNPVLAEDFNTAKNTIDDIIHNSKHIDLLTNDDIHTIFNISKQTGIVARELQYCASEDIKNQLTESASTLLTSLSQWADSQDENFSNHHSFKLLENN